MMKKTIALIIFVFLSLNSVFAATTAGQFLKTGVGAKSIALGRANTVSISDPSALYWNPAGLAQINGEKSTIKKIEIDEDASFNELQALAEEEGFEEESIDSLEVQEYGFEMRMYSTASVLSGDRQIGMAGLAFTGPGGTYGAGALGTQVPGIQGYDESGNETSSLDYNAYAGYLGFAREVRTGFRVGMSLMGMQENIDNSSVYGGGLNVGMQAVLFPLLSAGVSFSNLAGFVSNRTESEEKFDKLDTMMNIALAINLPFDNANIKFYMGEEANLDQPDSEPIQFNAGVSIGIKQYSYLMLGMNGSYPSGGIGFDFKHVKAAYAVNMDHLNTQQLQHTVELEVGF